MEPLANWLGFWFVLIALGCVIGIVQWVWDKLRGK